MTGIRQDLAFALRQMRRSPGFAVTAVLTLALGIAANVIVFGVLQGMVLRSVDLPQGDRVMTLGLTKLPFPAVAYPEVRDVRDANTVFSAVAAYEIQNFGLETNGVTKPIWGLEVSGQYFEAVAIKLADVAAEFCVEPMVLNDFADQSPFRARTERGEDRDRRYGDEWFGMHGS